MKNEYDFTHAVTGKFYKKNVEFHTPVYLEPELESYFIKIAKIKKQSLNEVINEILVKDIEIAKMVSIK